MKNNKYGIGAVNFDYALDTFKGVCELNNYEMVINGEEVTSLRTYSYSLEGDKLFRATLGKTDNIYLIAELINLSFKFLQILGFDDVKVNIGENEHREDIISILDGLGLAYIEDSAKTTNSEFELLVNSKTVGTGSISLEKSEVIIDFERLNEHLNEIGLVPEKTPLDVYLIAESEDEYSDALILGASLRDLGFKTEIDYNVEPLNEKIETAKKINTTYIIVASKDNLKDYKVKVIDAKTLEERTVLINDLADELYVNF